ncbi:PAS domain-containing protein [Phaeobacter sp. 11ANDIMAR09]|uniref:PAS domain-containing protein n=1 Tax=Phaeobacter sp. 11ANDIMAR09 TaxID=1225647 RepID=UPI0006C86D4A|nr:PAS domain-containing protein [Phaeobacter sp. 11ANDIMAR09]KPD11183.1 diguanylate cyclase [Phaeobacter sp. 11ANDIMAR09]OIQ34053.1 MAG: diguanylate cyclase [Roseobacter sp. MedPE-SWchi]
MFFGDSKNTSQDKGHNKVVPMTNFRNTVPVSPMRQAEAYWTALRRGDDIPSRSQIDPRGLENILSQTFILERVAPGIARFRLAGQKVNEMAGMEVRGMPITAFFTPDARKQMSAALEHMFEAPAIIEIEMQTEGSRLRGRREARMLLLPLRSDLGDVSRALGVFVSEGNPTKTSQRFSITSIEMRAIGKATDDTEFKSKSRGTDDVNTPNPEFAELQSRISTETSILQEARDLASRKSAKPARDTARSDPKSKSKGSHLRLVSSRDDTPVS